LSVAVVRLCLDSQKSARSRHETYVGTRLPEPVATPQPRDRESISLAFLVLLEALSPLERAIYLLHQVFEYSHTEVAEALGMSAAAVRQSFHRAKAHVADNRPRFAPSEEDHVRLLLGFGAALADGNVAAFKNVLAEDAVLWADGGGKVRGAALRPVHGGDNVARFFAGLVAKTSIQRGELTMDVQRVNGWPALVARVRGVVIAVITIETDGERVVAVRNVVNPEKLALAEVN
jgi:RNA polymerase sigma-70 factor (ECF subfamily)